jgi:hypothetical protein
VCIVPTALGDDGPVLGCAWLARQVVIQVKSPT